jgi:hypothetical protein
MCCRTDGERKAADGACLYRHGRSTMKTDTQLQQDVIAELAWDIPRSVEIDVVDDRARVII